MLDKTPLNTGIYIGGPSKLVIHVTAAGKDISGKFPRKPPKSCSTDGCGNMGEKSSVFQTCLSCFREGSPVKPDLESMTSLITTVKILGYIARQVLWFVVVIISQS